MKTEVPGVQATQMHHCPRQMRDTIVCLGDKLKVAVRQRFRKEIPPDKISEMQRVELCQPLTSTREMGKHHIERAAKLVNIDAGFFQQSRVQAFLK